MTSGLDSEWNVDRIKKELKKEKETKLDLDVYRFRYMQKVYITIINIIS